MIYRLSGKYMKIRFLLLDINLIIVLLLYILRSNLNKSFNIMGDLNRWTRWHYSWVVFDAKYNWWDEKCVSGVTTISQFIFHFFILCSFNGLFERLNRISFPSMCFLKILIYNLVILLQYATVYQIYVRVAKSPRLESIFKDKS